MSSDASADWAEITSNLRERLKEITANPKPSYDIDGQKVSWNEYQEMLLEAIAKAEAREGLAEGPYVIETGLYT